ncbi:unnamed protein product [Rotaria sp. Silwood1]|nr:unnamed protein product [Rotaria sp. Silwood1]CAF3923367.1 unnamed protein product [Rotaria sp. Silwood1]CAF4682421.1 unnamed protein product [Rotaria sp. Silwood1]CAF5007741.1 unnamed protein product [Rotaria sp. Silwood1]
MESCDSISTDETSSSSFSSSKSINYLSSFSSSKPTKSSSSSSKLTESSSSSSKPTEPSSSSSKPTESSSLLLSISPKPTITKTTSNKRKTMLTINCHQYQLKNFNKNKTIKFWRCASRSCGVLLHTNLNDEFVRFSGKTTEHSHLPNPAELEIRNLKEVMRQRAENELAPLQEIAEQEVRKGLLTGEALAVLPNITNIGHSLVHTRRKMIPPIPNSSSFIIPDIYTKDYHNHHRLLLYDSDDPKFSLDQLEYIPPSGRILIWSSDVQLNLLFNSERLHMDGTFSSAPPNFDQVFVIQAIHHGTCVPVVYALLPDRKAPTYINLFNVLFVEAKKLNKIFNPSIIMTDFEPGLSKSISIEFTEETIQKGCFFHFCQAVYRHVQSTGLSSTYLDNIMVRSAIRQLMALALVPESHAPILFINVAQELTDVERDEIQDLLDYFNNYWMRKISTWNVFNTPDRTNNYSEGYNHRFKRRLQKSHPNIWVFMDSLRKEINTIHDLIVQINTGMKPRSKRSQSKIAEQRMKELYDRFNNNKITAQDLLRGLSFFVANEK